MALADRFRVQPLAPALIVALRAGEIHLAVALVVEDAPPLESRGGGPVDANREGGTGARVRCDERG